MFSPNGFNPGQRKNKKPIVYKHYIRKFPGPAGLSPDLPPSDVEKLVSEETGMRGISNNGILLGSTYLNMLLSKPCYQRLIEDYSLNESNSPLNHLTLQVVSKAFIRKAKKDMKVPFLGLLVSSISLEHGISLKLMDPTHEVNAVVHQNVWEEISGDVKVNSAIALMQVPVIASCTVRPPITLFISRKNILAIYTETENEETEVKTFNSLSESDLKKTCSEWLTQMGMNPFGKTTPLRSETSLRTSSDHVPPNAANATVSSSGGSSNAFKWTPDEDFLGDFDFTMDELAPDMSDRRMTGDAFNRDSGSKSEDFTPKRPKFDFGWSTAKSSPGFSPKNSGFREESSFPPFASPSKSSLSPQKMDSSQSPPELSQSEKIMVQEVLSGITFDDFDS